VQAPKEEKAKKERHHLHLANIKKQSPFFVKRKIQVSGLRANRALPRLSEPYTLT